MIIRGVDHVGIAVRSIEAVAAVLGKTVGLGLVATETIESQHARAAFLEAGETDLELLESTAIDGTIAKFIERKGEGLHHIALEVDDLAAALAEAKANGAVLIDEVPRKGARGRNVAFLHPKSTGGILIELVENPRLANQKQD